MRHHHLFADNFFSSLPLVEDLFAADTYYCGTLRKDRVGIPRQLQNVRLQRYESVKWQKDHSQVTVNNWKDNRNVYTIATNNDGSDVQRARTRFRQDEMITVPSVIAMYNKYMGGVDHCDQYRSYYNVGRTGRRWWKYLFWGLFNQALVGVVIKTA
ncbi:piggyBac transposable element-derived protein 3-like [Asterias rubens]|uniref:piggyBac transposable element-derived protein 3-like n=1 Tax=Asterias rubens TaxID=7604 RepID=UPI0014553374|nr:piggyBac transposable element-derived protein 3-like [Asterias rubens]